jgi:hypothetical protein
MNENLNPDFWRKCNSRKKPIPYRAMYWVCNVSSCNRKRTGLVFCTTACWDAHLPIMNHRESWAEERRAPSLEDWKRQVQEDSEGKPRQRKTKEVSIEAQEPASDRPTQPAKVILRRKTE